MSDVYHFKKTSNYIISFPSYFGLFTALISGSYFFSIENFLRTVWVDPEQLT
jgi:hypothetical protein